MIPKLQKMFSDFGNPIKVKSDNGLPFQSNEFKKFAETEGFKHHRIIPRHPQSNTSECFMKNVGKTIGIAHNFGEDPETAPNSYLQSYRATEHPATGKTPASLLFQGQQFRTKLPRLKQTYHDQTIQHKDLEYKQSLKRN